MAERELSPRTLQESAERGADYLVRNLRSTGKFVYQRDAATGRPLAGSYNLLRHFGSLWAMLDVRGDDPVVCERVARGLVWAADRFYVRTRRGGAFRKGDWLITGCSGLSLLAITTLSSIRGFTPADGIREDIVRYLLANQVKGVDDDLRHDFRHKISIDVPMLNGIRDDVTAEPEISPFRSNFYTGEILFGLIAHLATQRGAARSPGVHLAVTRSMNALMERDYGVLQRSHWMMYAIRHYAELIELPAGGRGAPDVRRPARSELVAWASRISASVLASTEGRHNTRSAPTACRVEAQVQFLDLIDANAGDLADHAKLRAAVLRQIEVDCALLLELQDEATGGFVGAVDDPIMQIDFTQHAISALKGAAAATRRSRLLDAAAGGVARSQA